MPSVSSVIRLRSRVVIVLVFIAGLWALVSLRIVAERWRLADEAEWSKVRDLDGWAGSMISCPAAEVQSALVAGYRLPELPSTHTGTILINGAAIDPRFDGWNVRMSFGYVRRYDAIVAVKTRIIPPARFARGAQPSEFWWAVENARGGIMVLGILVWTGGMALMVSVRGVRGQIAPVCFAAALAIITAAAMSLLTSWTPLHPGGLPWMIAGAAMGFIALIAWLRKDRRVDEGFCNSCGYDLTGNVSGICPECGIATAAGLRKARLDKLAPLADRLDGVAMMTEPEDAPEEPGDSAVFVEASDQESVALPGVAPSDYPQDDESRASLTPFRPTSMICR